MKNFSVIMTDEVHQKLKNHLIRCDEQEDLCFATYISSTGSKRLTGIITEILLPEKNDREVHGNVGFMPAYFERVLKIASNKKEGIAFLHSHPFRGWQGMSRDDVTAETRMSPAVFASTGLPLLGLTIGSDSIWSARFWIKHKTERRKYIRKMCESVRVIGKGLKIIYNDNLLPPSFDSEKQLRTISAWGKRLKKICQGYESA